MDEHEHHWRPVGMTDPPDHYECAVDGCTATVDSLPRFGDARDWPGMEGAPPPTPSATDLENEVWRLRALVVDKDTSIRIIGERIERNSRMHQEAEVLMAEKIHELEGALKELLAAERAYVLQRGTTIALRRVIAARSTARKLAYHQED